MAGSVHITATLLATLVVVVSLANGYDNQVILMMKNDGSVREKALLLYNKHSSTSTLLLWNYELLDGFQYIKGLQKYDINSRTRVYVVSDSSELETCTAHAIGNILTHLIMRGKAVKGANVGRISFSFPDSAATLEASFISHLVVYLYNKGITTEVGAMIAPVAVSSMGQKVTKQGITWVHKAKNIKIVASVENKMVVVKDDEEYEEDEMETSSDGDRDSFLVPPLSDQSFSKTTYTSDFDYVDDSDNGGYFDDGYLGHGYFDDEYFDDALVDDEDSWYDEDDFDHDDFDYDGFDEIDVFYEESVHDIFS